MKRVLLFLAALLILLPTSAKTNKATVTLYCELHCQACCDKIMKNIAFERGVKDIQFNMEEQSVRVTYDTEKTDVPTLQKAFAKIGKPATTNKPTSTKDETKASDSNSQTHSNRQ